MLHGLALVLFAMTLYLGFIASVGVYWAYRSESGKTDVYRRELETFAIAEAAQNRYEQMVAAVRGESLLPPRPVQSEANLTSEQRRRQIANYINVFGKTPSPTTRRRILATLPFFKKTLLPIRQPDHPFLRLPGNSPGRISQT